MKVMDFQVVADDVEVLRGRRVVWNLKGIAPLK